jgi:hypothetical protein
MQQSSSLAPFVTSKKIKLCEYGPKLTKGYFSRAAMMKKKGFYKICQMGNFSSLCHRFVRKKQDRTDSP